MNEKLEAFTKPMMYDTLRYLSSKCFDPIPEHSRDRPLLANAGAQSDDTEGGSSMIKPDNVVNADGELNEASP